MNGQVSPEPKLVLEQGSPWDSFSSHHLRPLPASQEEEVGETHPCSLALTSWQERVLRGYVISNGDLCMGEKRAVDV